jgi:hypothetical protein
LPLPVRPILGPSPHDVVWREADSARVRNILQNRHMLGRMSTAAGKRIRVDAEPDRVGELSRWQSEIGRFACKPLTLVILAGRSSWLTSGEWQTTSTTMRRDIPARRAEAQRCCKASQFVAAATAG